jgi:hypothetical protein
MKQITSKGWLQITDKIMNSLDYSEVYLLTVINSRIIYFKLIKNLTISSYLNVVLVCFLLPYGPGMKIIRHIYLITKEED